MSFELLEFTEKFLPSLYELLGGLLFYILLIGFYQIVARSDKYKYLSEYIERFF